MMHIRIYLSSVLFCSFKLGVAADSPGALISNQIKCTLMERKNTTDPSGIIYEKTGVMNGFTRWRTPGGYTASFEPMKFGGRDIYRLILFSYENNRSDQMINWIYKADLKTCLRTNLFTMGRPGVNFDYVSFACSPAGNPNGCDDWK